MKKPGMKRALAILIAAVFLYASGGSVTGVCEGTVYPVNEWNYVDGSMDVSGGIPDDASGALDRIRRNGVLRVGTEPYNPPMSYIDFSKGGSDHYAGADMQLARLANQHHPPF